MDADREAPSQLQVGVAPPAVFFDIGDTLAAPVLTPPPSRLERLDVFPYVPGVLARLRSEGARLGIISNTGDEPGERIAQLLGEAGIGGFFDPGLLVFSSVVGLTKDTPEIFRLAAQRASHGDSPGRCVFVGEDAGERSRARSAGLRVAPHPQLAAAALNGAPLHYLRITVPPAERGRDWRVALEGMDLVPLHVSGDDGSQALAIAGEEAALALDDLGFEVDRLGAPDAPLQTTPYLLRDDRAALTGFLTPEGQAHRLAGDGRTSPVLSSSGEGLLVAVPASRSVEDFHFPQAYHGHNLKLLGDPALLAGAAPAAFAEAAADPDPPGPDELTAFQEITDAVIRGYVERYAGAAPLEPGDAGAPVASRHIDSPDNSRVAAALARELEAVGADAFTVRLHAFGHEGRVLHNVEAELRGAVAELVLVTAHLDSTAAASQPYDPARDPAPGADDDASGVAGVLAAAAVLRILAARHPPRRTLRFVLFNAEEQGLVGSKAYARALAAAGASVAAVFQMDMIGHNVREPRTFELHAGFAPSPAVEALSLALARTLEALAPQVSPGLEPQVYVTAPGAPDPAQRRSDHASFHERGWPAVAVSEDFFAGPGPAAPAEEPNPAYHRREDTLVDFAYAAGVARAVAAAAWAFARA